MEVKYFERNGQRFSIANTDAEISICDNDVFIGGVFKTNGEGCCGEAPYVVTAIGGDEDGDGPYLCQKHAEDFCGMPPENLPSGG